MGFHQGERAGIGRNRGIVKKFGLKGIIAIAIAAIVLVAIDAIIARWATADPIMQETFGFSLSELGR